MFKKILFAAGLIIFIAGLSFLANLKRGEKYAETHEETSESYGIIAGGPLPCDWNVKSPEKVMSEDKSQAILISVENKTPEPCESILSLRAPGFEASPLREEQKINLEGSRSGSLSWVLSPRKTGSYDLAVSDMLNTKVFGITVTNTFGLNVFQAKIFSILGTLFGPMFTIPWWWDRLRRKKVQ